MNITHTELAERPVGVRGACLKWARRQQGLTMRQVRERGGPCPAYQSEVENGLKAEVTTELLVAWVGALGVTIAFARGDLPRFPEEPGRCVGLAAGVIPHLEGRNWTALTPLERARQVLRLIPQACDHLPRLVLAHVMGLERETLEAMMEGTHPILQMPMESLCAMTTLSEGFFREGIGIPSEQADLDEYLPAVQLARRAGITPEQLVAMVRRL